MAGAANARPFSHHTDCARYLPATIGQIAPVYFSKDKVPEIDGKFDDWAGLKGVYTRVMVYGGLFNAENSDAQFVVRTDGVRNSPNGSEVRNNW